MVNNFNDAWLHDCNYDVGVQTDYLLPLSLGIVTNNCTSKIVASLLNDIVSEQNTHLTTGQIFM
jgi:hypothetical protein